MATSESVSQIPDGKHWNINVRLQAFCNLVSQNLVHFVKNAVAQKQWWEMEQNIIFFLFVIRKVGKLANQHFVVYTNEEDRGLWLTLEIIILSISHTCTLKVLHWNEYLGKKR